MTMQQGKPPSCTSKSTNIGNAKTSSEGASELDGTKDSIALIPLNGRPYTDDNKLGADNTSTIKQSKGKKLGALESKS